MDGNSSYTLVNARFYKTRCALKWNGNLANVNDYIPIASTQGATGHCYKWPGSAGSF